MSARQQPTLSHLTHEAEYRTKTVKQDKSTKLTKPRKPVKPGESPNDAACGPAALRDHQVEFRQLGLGSMDRRRMGMIDWLTSHRTRLRT
ncbi:hypothetical protein F1880_009388 [Penicillium rolfsii]|nr:hypothetical protein F1880_009388 [Penicillium rolfsii]